MQQVRPAVRGDIPVLSQLIERSVRALHRDSYTFAQIELALTNVYGVDTALIEDGTYFVVESGPAIVACGGWSKRATLCGGDRFAGRADSLLDAQADAAKIRAFYVCPDNVRRGLASLLLERCEREAFSAGFRRAELGATLAGVPFYAARGYVADGRADVALPGGEQLAVVHMERTLEPSPELPVVTRPVSPARF
jgi:GNAT superfamily N-acetyltransferase